MSNLLQDLRFAGRLIRKSPGFAFAAILVLALGIGANTAIFSVVDTVLLKPLAFPQPEQLVHIWHTPPQSSFPGMTRFSVSPANFLDWQAQNDVFQGMSLVGGGNFNLTGAGEPRSVVARRVSYNFFSVLQAQPILGRTFNPDDDQPGHNYVVILSENFWRSQFNSDPGIVGKDITLNGAAYKVIGVMPTKYQYPIEDAENAPRFWTPLGLTPQERAVRGNHNYFVIGRLRPGVTVQQAQAEMNTISRRLEQEYPADDKGWGAAVDPANEDLVGDVRTPLLVLFGAVAFVLLIACANVANLVLARTVSRQREVAIRTALGASRARLLRQIISETVLLSLLGGVLGLLVAYASIRFIVSAAAAQLPRASEISLSVPVLIFAFAVSVLAGMLAGLLPALRMSKTNVNDALKQGTRASSDVAGSRTRGVLVVAEVALSLMLLIGAGLMIRSLWLLHRVDPGFDPHNVIAVMPSISRKTFQTPTQELAFYNQVLSRVRSLPGVQASGGIDDLPLSGGGSVQPVQLEGRPVQQMADQPEVSVRGIMPGYFKAMHIPLIRGRELGEQDVASAPGTVVISEAMAKRLWPNEDPIGKHLTMFFFPNRNREVVGIVGDVKDNGLKGAPDATLYAPFAQLEQPPDHPFQSFPIWIVVRASANAAGLIPAVTAAIHQANPELPVLGSSTLDEVIGTSLSQQRFSTMLLGIFAGLALFLAAIGIYSVLAYSVRRRVREIGIRMALGAQIKDVLQLVVIEGMKPTVLGLAIGIIGALVLGHLLSSMIYGVKSTDLLTFISVSIGLLCVGLLASIIPAYRATRVEPVKTLRDE